MRMLHVWESLAERYNKPLDEDDIVDLRDLSILKDRGVTRSAPSAFDFGSIADVDTGADADAGTDGDDVPEGEGEGEESADELDAFSSPAPPVPDELIFYKAWHVPPADETNPEDAEAFREFEEAERKRRELYGEEDEEDAAEVEHIAALQGAHDDNSSNVLPEPGVGRESRSPGSPYPPPKPARRKSRPPSRHDSSSEDEFATWDIDDTPVPPRRSVPPSDDIIDLTESRPPSPASPPPPRGRSQTLVNDTPDEGRSKPKPLPLPTVDKRPQTPDHVPPPAPVQQLLTPPRSSSATNSTPASQEDRSQPSEPDTPSPKFPKIRARYTPKPRLPSPSDDEEDEPAGPSSRPLPLLFPIGPPRKAKKTRLKAEVVIPVYRKSNASRTLTSSPEMPPPSTVPFPKRKNGKGKERAPADNSPQTGGGSSVSKPRRRSQSQPRALDGGNNSRNSPLPTRTRGLKRRRVSSLSSLSDSSTGKATSSPAVRSSMRDRNHNYPGSQSGYSSDIPPPASSSPVQSDNEAGTSPLLRHSVEMTENSFAEEENVVPPVRAPSRARSSAPQIPPAPLYPHQHAAHLYTPRHREPPSASGGRRRSADERHMYSTPAPSLQDPQAQYAYAQAWHNLSYLMASGVLPPLQPPLPTNFSYPASSISFPSAPFPPYTPSHQRHRTHPPHVLNTPSSSSSIGMPYSTPTHHQHPFPYMFDPAFSNGTLPPSSPISSLQSSPARSSPILRPASVPHGQRSRSRGRRVSFKLDAHERPVALSPPRCDEDEGEEEEDDGDDVSDSPPSREHARRPAPKRHSGTPGPSRPPKDKGKARADRPPKPRFEEEEESESEEEPLRDTRKKSASTRGRTPQRAHTPGPPPVRDKSTSRASAKGSKRKDKS